MLQRNCTEPASPEPAEGPKGEEGSVAKEKPNEYPNRYKVLKMKSLGARRITIKVGDVWETPVLHILLTKEDGVVVARCLDFTVSSHGNDEKDAMGSLADAVKEYVLTAIENNAVDTIHDPAHSKYWRMYNELEAKQSMSSLKRSIGKTVGSNQSDNIKKAPTQIIYA